MPRIIAGAARGRRLAVPARGTRPTADRVRESLFSALDSLLQAAGDDWHGIDVLDLYAGSGALGLEALSRGARSAVLVESDRQALRVIAANCAVVDLPGAVVVDHSVSRLGAPAAGTAAATLVLADPPYDHPASEVAKVLGRLHAGGWIADGALVVVERAARDADPPWPSSWTLIRERRYGDTRLWYGRSVGETGPPVDVRLPGEE